MSSKTSPAALPANIDDTLKLLTSADYVADRSLATSVFLALAMKRPLLLEGEAGVGKTEIAKVIAADALARKLVRLQCYEGLDVALDRLRVELPAADDRDPPGRGRRREVQGQAGRRHLLRALPGQARAGPRARGRQGQGPPVLLIDELDRTDEPFEAYLLEVLSDFQVTIPEIGTIKAVEPPIVVITSNRTREIHDAIKRRCFYHWVDYPDAVRELAILRRKAPHASEQLSQEVVAFVQRLRKVDLFKLPGVAETIDWSEALVDPGQAGARPADRQRHAGHAAQVPGRHRAHPGEEAERITAEDVSPPRRPEFCRTGNHARHPRPAGGGRGRSPRTSCTSRACCAARDCASARTG